MEFITIFLIVPLMLFFGVFIPLVLLAALIKATFVLIKWLGGAYDRPRWEQQPVQSVLHGNPVDPYFHKIGKADDFTQ